MQDVLILPNTKEQYCNMLDKIEEMVQEIDNRLSLSQQKRTVKKLSKKLSASV